MSGIPEPGISHIGSPTCTIAEGGTVSTEVDIRHFISGAIYLTSEFNTDTITFQGAEAVPVTELAGGVSSVKSGTFGVVNSATVTGATNNWFAIPASVMGMAYMKVVTGTATAAVATIKVSLKS